MSFIRSRRKSQLYFSGVCLLAVCTLAVVAVSPAYAQGADEIEEVVVTGIRKSLRDGISSKRDADNFVDVINAVDIGKLPDTNLAESLQRISGVQIVRDNAASREQLSGQTVNIRGLPTLATINGRSIIAGSLTRNFDFRTLASEGFGQLIVSKTATADAIEGGVGGTIELVTRSPLEFDETVFSVTALGAFLDYADTSNPSFSGLFSTKFLDDRVGLLISGSYEDLETRTDAYTARGGWVVGNGFTGSGFDFDNDGTEDAILPSDIRYWYQNDQRERLGFNGVLSIAASDTLELTFDVNYSEFDRDFFNGVFRTAGFSAANAVAGSLNIDSNGSLLAGSFDNALVQSDGRLEVDDVETLTYGFNADWDNGPWEFNFDIGYTEGSADGRQLINRYSLLNGANVTFDYRGQQLPDLVLDGGATDATDRSQYRTDLLFNNPEFFDNSETSTRFDVAFNTSDGFITKWSGGVRYADTQIDRIWLLQDGFAGAGLLANPVAVDQTTGDFNPASQSVLDPLLGNGFPVSDFLGDESGNFPRAFLYTVYPGGNINGPGDYANIYQLSPILNEFEGPHTDIDEETIAAYIRADFETSWGDVPVRGNFGIRFIETDVTSTAFQTQQAGGTALETEGNDYSNVLPSLNLVADLSDDLLFRFGIGRTMRRPDLDDLRSSLSADLSDNSASAGNVSLDPLVSDQIDIGLEWYFAEDGLLSGTVFFKDVEDFIATETETNVDVGLVGFDGGTLFTVTRPVNSGTADIVGFEVTYQQAFTSLPGWAQHLGLFTNFTYTDDDTSSGQSFQELSDQVLNIVAYYDDGRLDARLAYNWRSEYAFGGDGSNGIQFLGIDEIVEDSGQFDLSISYALNDNFSLLLEGINLTEEDFTRFSGVDSRLREFRTGERRISIGARATF